MVLRFVGRFFVRADLRMCVNLNHSVSNKCPYITSFSFSRVNQTFFKNLSYVNIYKRPCSSSSKDSLTATEGKSQVFSENLVNDSCTDEDLTLSLTEEDIQKISNGDPEIIKRIKYIQLEHEVWRQEGQRVPSKIPFSHWNELLTLPSPSTRRKFYVYLWRIEIKDKKRAEIKAQKREEYIKKKENELKEEDPYGVSYGLGKNQFFLRFRDSTMHKFYHHRVFNEMIFGRPLVIDLGLDEHMTFREAKNCAKQLEFLISQNRIHKQPFSLHFCNAPEDSKLMEILKKLVPTIYDDTFPINIHENSYLDLFPKKQLVYLSPHAREEMQRYDEDEVYIVGAMVDKSDPKPFSLAKAKKEKIRVKKFPLDRHLVWGMGSKSLTVNQVLAILLDLRLTGSWEKAFDHVPKRKLNRDFHPYPNQIASDEDKDPAEPRIPIPQLSRRENKSQVLIDHELLVKRKGFRGSSSDRGFVNSNKSSVNNTLRSIRSIMDD